MKDVEKRFESLMTEYKDAIRKIQTETTRKAGELLNEYVSEIDVTFRAKWADMNKNATLDEYKEEVRKGDYSVRKARCVLSLDFDEYSTAYEWLCENLLTDIPLLNGMGGSSTEENDEQIADLKKIYDYEWARHAHWYSIDCILVTVDGEPKFVIDPQGYSYARYVGLLD